MNDSDFSDIEFDLPIQNKENAEPSISNEYQDALLGFTQRTQRAIEHSIYLGEEIQAVNAFEKMLRKYNCTLREEDGGLRQICIEKGTFSELISLLNKNLTNTQIKEELLDSFEDALKQRTNLRLYLSPCSSPKGPQDTIFRALLSCIHTQVKVFDILLQQMNLLAKNDDEESSKLAVACVSQIRFLEQIVDSSSMFQSIFERNIEEWTPRARDYLIEALPEVLTERSSQNDAVLSLKDMLLGRPLREATSFQSTVINTMKLLRMDESTTKSVRQDLCRSVMNFDASVIPDLTALLLQTISFDHKSSLAHVLGCLSAHLKLESLRVQRASRGVTLDDVIFETFMKICRYIQLEGQKGWREASAFLRKSTSDDEDASISLFGYFETIMCLSLLSLEGCPPSILNIFKSQAANSDKMADLMDSITFALKFKKVASRYLHSLVHLSQQCLFSPIETVQSIGAHIYRNLFINVADQRQDIFKSMLKHLFSSISEASAVLNTFELLVKHNHDQFLPFAELFTNCLEDVERLSSDNLKRLYKVIILLCSSNTNNIMEKLNQTVKRFLCSVKEKEQIWGLFGALMQFSHLLSNENNDRENEIALMLQLFDEKCTTFSLRSILYTEMATILQENIRSSRSSSLLSWVDSLFRRFRKDFFVEKDEEEIKLITVNEDRFVNSACTLWLKTEPYNSQLIELVPLLHLLQNAAFLRQRWTNDDDETQIAFNQHFIQLFFAFEANITIPTSYSSTETANVANTLYFVINWIREILNIFAGCSAISGISLDEIQALWLRKFRQVLYCQKKLNESIEVLKTWPLPDVVSSINVVAENKRPKRGAPKKSKKAKIVDTDNGEELEVEEELPQEAYEKTATLHISILATRFRKLKFSTVVRLLQYVVVKRKPVIFLLHELQSILKEVLPKKTPRAVPWNTTECSKYDTKFHGNATAIWNHARKASCLIWTVMDHVVEYLRADLNSSNVVDRPTELMEEMSTILTISLQCLTIILSCEEINSTGCRNLRTNEKKVNKRRDLMEKLEKFILNNQGNTQTRTMQEEAEKTFLGYLVSISDVVPNVETAVALVEAVSNCSAWTDELRENMAHNVLNFLKKEWLDSESNTLKPAQLSNPVKILLEKYITLRPEEYQLSCILWLLANKITELVPDEERRRSKISSYEEVEDPRLSENDKRAIFWCFNRGTFANVYKVLFTSLGNIIYHRFAVLTVVNQSELVKEWKTAANTFCILCLMLRVKELRNASVLQTALKEGKRFLSIFTKNSSFMNILEDSTKLGCVSDEIAAIIKAIQVGNRSLQNISVYAKTSRSVALLKGLPELRATSELWMRSIRSAVVRLGCQDAFEIGLLKSRDIDGEEIRIEEELESEDGSGEENEEDQSGQSTIY